MKNIVSVFILFSSFHSFAKAAPTVEMVNCADSSGAWLVNFMLNGKLVSNLEFIYQNQFTAKFPTLKVFVNRALGKIYYDLRLDPISYFDFERKKGSNQLKGAFYLLQNPTGLETNVTCNAHTQ